MGEEICNRACGSPSLFASTQSGGKSKFVFRVAYPIPDMFVSCREYPYRIIEGNLNNAALLGTLPAIVYYMRCLATHPIKSQAPRESCFGWSFLDSIPRATVSSALPQIMAQHGYNVGSGPSRLGQWEDRGTGLNRPEMDGAASVPSQPDAFGRTTTYVDGSPLYPASSSSYVSVGGGLRGDATPHPLLSVHAQHETEPQSLPPYSSTLPHHPSHHNHYQQDLTHTGHSPSHAFQNQQTQHQYQQPQLHQHQQQHAREQHLHFGSDQSLEMHMSGNPTGSQSLGTPHPSTSYTLQHHSEHQHSSLDGQRGGRNRAEAAAEPHTPRPPNAWILYRSQKFREIQQNREAQTQTGSTDKPKSQAEISRIISQMWQNETTAVKQRFESMADEKKLAHQKMYPTYRYRPKKKGKSKQASSSHSNDQRQTTDTKSAQRALDGGYASGSQDYDTSERSSSAGHSAERRSGSDPQRPEASQSGSASMHDLSGRDFASRKSTFGDRRDRGELSVMSSYGRTMPSSLTSGESHSFAHSTARMHPYGERPSNHFRQDNFKSTDLFGEAVTSSSAYASGNWTDSDTLGGTSSNTYFDGTRSAPAGYSSLGSARLPPTTFMGSNTLGGAPSMLSFSPSQQQPARQSVPSQHLQHPIEYRDNGASLVGMPGAGGSLRQSSMTHSIPQFGQSFGDSRPELASGLAVSGDNCGVQENLDAHRRMQPPS
ncbi:hypothetical protein PHSY_001785 [Pseudozyma hubeiensis SY62]|uniref:HMG box domain-containing protein n=1 Tax=Pseudozyma hubeiensis (strain SY62) TaxID=1305764 RepID=R9NZK3_PSEHS|nr:hypothetical protein PHSY_001785 [Pseudozyma hubeiensis SY62]GAC94214.1 hypothetical protein PHSY_001785 [Pseudozyma hubeiensis SY62]